jgi:hypothetical protein
MAAEAFVLFLDKKNQKSSQQRGFFALRPLPGRPAKTTGCNTFARLSHKAPLQQKFANAPPGAQVHQFYLPSPEAFLLTLCPTPTSC